MFLPRTETIKDCVLQLRLGTMPVGAAGICLDYGKFCKGWQQEPNPRRAGGAIS